ncbi:Flavodoxin [Sedimentisphaera cyanobacteriorum]|uniref:Flavodoxin n=1 Tax=Sedimentisphaera cyanobacteriorum TaxID=1940790 RepID=A0A1Q2HQ01_9BACT|nr:NAD(P)H-dependent oxidoreductase [Sedimentisphaera cyanobacteriorum]AQQ09313.1 Flavodoxin [Sedimentisphaera cyanobacteriorum]
MAKALVIYYSRSGNTKRMAELISDSISESSLESECKAVADVTVEELAEADAVILGSPTYYGQMAGEMKKLLDETVKRHGRFDGKVGGAFTSAVNVGGGNETTLMGILSCLLVHGFVIQGDPQGDHYGPVSLSKPNERVEKQCKRFGKRIAELTLKIAE